MDSLFKEIDEEFVCENCGHVVPKLGYSCRNHCNKCLYSKHVDNYPGDRMCSCHGKLKPIAILHGKKDSYKIVYRCEKCGSTKNLVTHHTSYEFKGIEFLAFHTLQCLCSK